MLNEKALKTYLRKKFRNVSQIKLKKLSSGVHGSGFLVEIKTKKDTKSYVVKTLMPEGFGHEYPSDRAGIFLLDLDEFKNLPKHVKAIDVLAEMEDSSIKSIGGGREYYLLMEKGEGRHYFNDLVSFARKERLDEGDIKKIKAMASYLAEIHSVKKDSKTLYWRKLRDTVGHGECLMGVFDTYPEGVLSYDEMSGIIKKSVDWIYRLKPKYRRLSQIHGDFHPGNIWFKKGGGQGLGIRGQSKNSELDFILLDRSRGPWGEPADDITALAINYIFFSIKNHNEIRGPYLEGLKLFFDEYVRLSGDTEIYEVLGPFFAFRGAVVANPVFYPEVTKRQRKKIFRFIHNILKAESFSPERSNELIP
ncbi:MAG: aminoglycoside phosphotransferase family protein [Nitrospirae bacterium]|nr:MAG: aminoglycoside phosphotransferase family protein [Nitrospirota bacterium]